MSDAAALERRARGAGARRRRLRLRRRARGRARLAPPAARAGRGRPSRSDAGHAARRALPALPRAARARPSSTSSGVEEVDAAIVAYPHGAAAPVVAELRGLGLAGRRPLRRLPPPRPARPTSAGTAPHGDAGAARGRRLRAHRAATASGSRGAELVANPGCYPTAALLALAPLAEAGLIADVVDRRQVRASPGAGRGGGDATHSSTSTENFSPYGVDGHRHAPEIEQELERARRRRRRSPSSRTCCRSTRACWRAATSTPDRASSTRTSSRALYAERYAERAVRRAGRRAARRPRRARHQRLPHPRRRRRAAGRSSVRGDRQPLEGRLRPGDPEPEPDARPRRDGGLAVSTRRQRLLPLALGRAPPTASRSSIRPRSRPGFRAAGVACGLKGGGRDRRRPRSPATPRRSARRCC